MKIIKPSIVLQRPNSFAGLLVFIPLILIHRPSLPIMASLAKRLPILLIPEQSIVSSMRLDMIYNRCLSQLSGSFALRAKRMLCQELFPRFLPLATVATRVGVRSIANMLVGMLITITIVRQMRASQMLARFLGFHRHKLYSSHMYGYVKG